MFKTLPLGAAIRLEGPYGSLTLHDDPARPAVFLAGGIGITPFRSLLVDAAQHHRPHRLFLFYATRHPAEAPFLEELHNLERENSRYTLVATRTARAASSQPWPGETGYITPAMLAKCLDDVTTPIYYVAGPPGMVTAMPHMLREVGVHDEAIHTEEFFGY